MFVDELELSVCGGRGGNGVVSFRREKYVAKGGPDGGDGGNGGSVYLWADPSKHSFLDLRYKRLFKAANGEHGRSKNQHGARSADLIIPVPLGTIVRDNEQKVLADLTFPGQKTLVAGGGRGGKGNARFASSRRRVPRLAERGLPGVERAIFLELKLMAQVGLVGFPNAGKSTLLGRISEAKPKTAAYPFTTLTPNLGVVKVGDEGSFIVADLPGLIEGSHQGAGLGHRFLRHVERNLLLLFLIDLSTDAHPEPAVAYGLLKKELEIFSSRLVDYPRVVVGNKLDLGDTEERLEALQNSIKETDGVEIPVFGISAATGQGVAELIRYLLTRVNKLNEGKSPVDAEEIIRPLATDQTPLKIEKSGDLFVISGAAIERMAAKTDFDNEEGLLRFQKYCRRSGLDKELSKMGIKEGDTVQIGKEELIYYE
ncbi:MAG: GTPase ObgE [Clostridia bacterium]|nr:GTPase ObgE [Clostridia bacterium]